MASSARTDRCVNCARLPGEHDDGACRGSSKGKRYGTMALPEGRICADCYHLRPTCSWLLSRIGTETSCDWFPVRFVSIPGMRALLDGAEIPALTHVTEPDHA